MDNKVNINSLRMIRIVMDLSIEQMADHFLVSSSYISALEKGKRKINFRTLKYGLDNLKIKMEDYLELDDFRNYLENGDFDMQSKFRYMLIKTVGVVSPNLRKTTDELLDSELNIIK